MLNMYAVLLLNIIGVIETLDLSHNKLEGQIPMGIGKLSNSKIDLKGNKRL